MCVCAYLCVGEYAGVCMNICIVVCKHEGGRACVRAWMYMIARACVRSYVRMYISMYVCIKIMWVYACVWGRESVNKSI